MDVDQRVPPGLRRWFVVHFVADLLFAVPLFVAPRFTLELVGWQSVDPIASRMVAAALFGIGIESLLCRNGNADVFVTMLNLKIIWSGAAIVGITWGTVSGGPLVGWGLLAIFAGFNVLWVTYRFRLARA